MTGDTNSARAGAPQLWRWRSLWCLLIWLVFGVVDLGQAIFTDIGIKEAAQAGAHYFAFTESADATSTATAAVNSTSTPQLVESDITASCTAHVRDSGTYGTVQVATDYELDLIAPIVGSLFGGTIDLSETTQAERYFPCPP